MIDLVVEAGITIASIGFFEGVIKPTATRIVRRRLLKWLPVVIDVLDPLMPEAIRAYSRQELEEWVRLKFEEITGESWSYKEIRPFWEIYDLRVNADKVGITAVS